MTWHVSHKQIFKRASIHLYRESIEVTRKLFAYQQSTSLSLSLQSSPSSMRWSPYSLLVQVTYEHHRRSFRIRNVQDTNPCQFPETSRHTTQFSPHQRLWNRKRANVLITFVLAVYSSKYMLTAIRVGCAFNFIFSQPFFRWLHSKLVRKIYSMEDKCVGSACSISVFVFQSAATEKKQRKSERRNHVKMLELGWNVIPSCAAKISSTATSNKSSRRVMMDGWKRVASVET